MKSFFVTGTDTDIGKTFICSILARELSKKQTTYYYKPIQSGEPKDQDQVTGVAGSGTMGFARKCGFKKDFLPGTSGESHHIGEDVIKILESTYSFKAPLAPCLAAQLEGQTIQTEKIVEDFKNRPPGFYIVEGAGGIEVPINDHHKMKDLMLALHQPVLLVTSTRLGTINHTLLSVQALKQKGLYCLGIVLNGDRGFGLKEIVEKETGLPVLFEVPHFKQITEKRLDDFSHDNGDFRNFLNLCCHSFTQSTDQKDSKKGRRKSVLNFHGSKAIGSEEVLPAWSKDKGHCFEHTDLETLDRQFVWHPFTQHGIVKKHPIVTRGEGVYLWYEGQKVIDAISSWWVNLFGHCHPRLSESLSQQAHQLEHILFAGFSHKPAIELSRTLIRLVQRKGCQLSKVFFSDNGSTSVEVALKMVHQYQQISGHHKKKRFLALRGSYHGDTLGAMSLGERDGFNQVFSSLLFDNVDFLDPFKPLCLREFFDRKGEELAAVVVEPMVQGASGMRMYPVEFLNELAKFVKKYKVMVICDEVFTGFYRTGKMFAFEHSDLRPDLLCLSKGLTGGYLPLAVTLTGESLYQAFLSDSMKRAFLHGHSYTANPLACRVACATMDLLMDPKIPEQIEQIKDWTGYWIKRLSRNPGIFNARQLGTIGAMEVTNENPHYFKGDFAWNFTQKALDEGILLRPLGGTVYAVPPYCVNEKQIEAIYSGIERIVNRGL